MTTWLLTNTHRVAAERKVIEQLSTNSQWFSLERWHVVQSQLCAEGTIRFGVEEYAVRLVYPDQFPNVPAWVQPQDPQAFWSGHQYGTGGSLCLELRPDTWEPSATGADVLTSAMHLLELERPHGGDAERPQAPSAHRINDLQSYNDLGHPLFISAGCRDRLLASSARELRATYSDHFDERLPIFAHDASDRDTGRYPPDSGGFSKLPVFVSTETPPAAQPNNRDDLLACASLNEEDASALASQPIALVVFANGSDLGALLVLNEIVRNLHVLVGARDEGIRSGRALGADAVHVAIVGVGSVGSKLAESLLRSGVRKLTIVDGDVMLPANIERHILGWSDVGYRKVHALERRLMNLVPNAELRPIATNLDWQRSARAHAAQVESISDCDVIVDATGDIPTALFLGAVATANNRAFVSVEVFEGGIGALVASCLPKRDPPYATARTAFHHWCAGKNVPAPRSTGRPYVALSEEGAPMVADDAAVSIAAGLGARVVLDIVDGKPAPQEAAWLLIGFQKAWLFDGLGCTVRLSVGVPNIEDPETTGDKDSLEFVSRLMKDTANEARSSS